MDSFKKLLLWLALISLSLMAVSGCTRKNNLTGNNWSNVNTKTIDDPSGIIDGFSFPSDTLRVITGSEAKLLSGDYQDTQAVAYMRFVGLPRQATIDLVDLDSCYVNLTLVKRSPATATKLKLRLYKINGAWNDTLSVMNNMEYIPNTETEIADSISIFGIDVKLKLTPDVVKNWETNADSTGFNIAVKVVDNGFVEFRSAEGSDGAKLNLRYRKVAETAYQVFNTKALKDSYTLTANQEAISTAWKISNPKATRIYLKWVSNPTLFKDNDGNQMSSQDIKRLTVNRAVVVLHAKNNPYYLGGALYSLFPFNLTREDISITSPPLIADYQALSLTPFSTGTVVGDSLEIDVTPLIQAYISGEKPSNGFTIQSTQERQSFGEIEFYDFSTTTPEAKKPYVRITFTPPYLKQ
ncbi:MAG: hypothetical protein M0P99_06530 [Candidatus Cloacimonetes bacterium]|nr:hypothetical protein [Candidatus Cloacimonadota bacterium]